MNELPESWQAVLLGEISSINWGNTSITKKSYTNEGFTAFSASGPDGYLKHWEKEGDSIILSAIGARCGKCFWASGKWTAIKNTITIEFDEISKQLPHYLFRFLNDEKIWPQKGGGQPFITLARAREVKVPIPPANEQKRIVDKLEKCEARIDAAKAALDDVPQLLEHYRQSVLAAAFRGDLTRDWRTAHPDAEPAEQLLERLRDERRQRWEQAELEKYEAKGKAPPKNWKQKYKSPQPLTEAQLNELPELPKGWCWAKSEEISTRVTVGHVGSMKNEYRSEGVPFLRGQNVRENRFDANGLLYVSEGFHKKLSKSTLAPGDIVVTRSGDVGTACVIPKSLGEANCSDLVIIQEPLSIVPQVIAYFINSSGKAMINKGKVGVAITHFNTKSVAEMPLPIPPLEEQRCILTKLDQLTNRCSEISSIQSQNVSALKTATQSLLSKAFRGELVPQDPNDEPASKLLERIAEARKQAKPTPRKPARKQAQVI